MGEGRGVGSAGTLGTLIALEAAAASACLFGRERSALHLEVCWLVRGALDLMAWRSMA